MKKAAGAWWKTSDYFFHLFFCPINYDSSAKS
jgi:hypothetical protein